MSVRITSQKAALYCSTTGRAFGPVFDGAYQASSFLRWLEARDDRDPREIPADELDQLKDEFDSWEPSDVEMFGAGAA